MKRLVERQGQIRLFCPDLDHRLFYSQPHIWHWDLAFDESRFQDAVDRHEFEAWLDDGEYTFLVCTACDAELWVPNRGDAMMRKALFEEPVYATKIDFILRVVRRLLGMGQDPGHSHRPSARNARHVRLVEHAFQ